MSRGARLVAKASDCVVIEHGASLTPAAFLFPSLVAAIDRLKELRPQSEVVGTRAETLAKRPGSQIGIGLFNREGCQGRRCPYDRPLDARAGAVEVGPVVVARELGLKWHTAHELQRSLKQSEAMGAVALSLVDEAQKLAPIAVNSAEFVSGTSLGNWQVTPPNRASDLRDIVEERLARDVTLWSDGRPQCGLDVIGRLWAIWVECQITDQRSTELAQRSVECRYSYRTEHVDSKCSVSCARMRVLSIALGIAVTAGTRRARLTSAPQAHRSDEQSNEDEQLAPERCAGRKNCRTGGPICSAVLLGISMHVDNGRTKSRGS